jgi:uncharacterized protein (DUF2126 family)
MSIHVALHHKTTYRYDRLVGLSPHLVRLRPAPHCRTPILSYALTVEPAAHFVNWQQDVFANYLARFVFPERTTELTVAVDLVAEMSVYNPFDFFLDPIAETYPFRYDDALARDLAPFRTPLPAPPLLAQWIVSIDRHPKRTMDFLVGLNQRLQQDISYIIRMEPGVQTPEETLTLKRGSCRDTAWLMVQIARHLGLAARFVSGYLIQLTPDVKALDGPSGTEVDFTDLHAWCEVYLPGAGWIGFDPTSGLVAGEGHIPLACTPEPTTAAAITGASDKAEVVFDFTMHVSRLKESPRTTKPYTPEVWSNIQAFGHQVDAKLRAGDVRLTQGGEPTFVSIDDMEAPEWNTTALGAHKRERAADLVKRLRRRFGPGGLLHWGQGKWYPGESLPRWAYTNYWRADGQPVWQDEALIGDPAAPTGADSGQALRFAASLVERLQAVDPHVLPAWEDAYYYMWKERRLPINVTAADSRLAQKEERERLMRVFDRGLDQVVGYVFPIAKRDGYWQSSPWFLRGDDIRLIPGDSPIGLRLPLDSLPWVAPSDYPHLVEADPFTPRGPLPPARDLHEPVRQAALRVGRRPTLPPPSQQPQTFESASGIVRTAMCFEPRDGHLHVFMPPLETAEAYLELVAAIEDVAADLGQPVFIEGYTPPRDPRLKSFSVTPDPGVIEVNIFPASDWGELVDTTKILYEEARLARLGTEKFMLDGRHVGTGGGNHITLGGATAADSPLLRRPDVLKSLVGYWQAHPSLSFLFSGLFIGPTSQAPRIDEARTDQVYELDIAFREIAKAGPNPPPWLVDRVFRNILVDATGNTHRSEFCIDKLYSPDSATGRLGLVELRAFEMPPHADMSLAQSVLLRAMVARFWDQPWQHAPVRWGTALHDRFLLPYFVADDFRDVLDDMARHGLPLDPAWFAPHHEFRFPRVGEVSGSGIRLEVRNALEPWHVLGEEPGAAGTVRFVDSSVERVQVLVQGLTPERHTVTCNGRALPLQPTGIPGEGVAGVRFKAWATPSALHPTVPVHAPLRFDIVDRWSERAILGCRYHVAHPGGRNHTTFPVNAYEAESRRLARFEAMGHTGGRITVPPEPTNPAAPSTLDLRWG